MLVIRLNTYTFKAGVTDNGSHYVVFDIIPEIEIKVIKVKHHTVDVFFRCVGHHFVTR